MIFILAQEVGMDLSPDSGINELQGLSLEEQERQKEEWRQELAKVYLTCFLIRNETFIIMIILYKPEL